MGGTETDPFCTNEFPIVVSTIRIHHYSMNETKQKQCTYIYIYIYRILSDSARNTKIGEKSRIKIYSETNDEKLFKDFERHFRTCRS